MSALGRIALLLGLLAALTAAFVGTAAAEERPDPAITRFEMEPDSTQAGGHPDVKIGIEWQVSNGSIGSCKPKCLAARIVGSEFPTGFIGNPHAAPKCTLTEFSTAACPPDSQIGIAVPALGLATPLYNMETRPDQAGLVAFTAPVIQAPIMLDQFGRTDSDYGLSVRGSAIPQTSFLNSIEFELWGVPASTEHNDLRFITPLEGGACPPGNCAGVTGVPPGIPAVPYLQNPTTCGSPGPGTASVEYYEGANVSAEVPWPATTGCDQLNFNPSQTTKATTTAADTVSGVDVDLKVPQSLSPFTASQSQIKSNTVTLPEGLTLNPGAADGKVACSDALTSIGTLFAAICPDFAKVGTLELDVAALPGPIPGALYLGEPKPGEPYRLVLTADGFATHVKLIGSVKPDPVTGQLTVSFELPQAPLQEINMHFFGSERGFLATPEQCGTYAVKNRFVPWDSALSTQESTSFVTIDSGPNGSACPNGPRPFAPTFAAGAANSTAGMHSPFTLRLNRPDGDQNITGIQVKTPPGFAATVKGVPYCPEAAIAQVTAPGYTGKSEQASSACPVASQVGIVRAGAGPGSRPLIAPGKVYLAGPYKGSPLSFVIVVPGVSGPYDLGNVAVRAAIDVDPTSAQVTTTSDPLPQILEGVPLRTRSLEVVLDRPDFAINPTNCEPFAVDATVAADEGASKQVSNHFQVSACNELAYAPKLTLSFTGGVKRRGHPAIHARLTTSPGEANTRQVTVKLPKGELLDNAHLSNVCTKVDFAKDTCPEGSRIGSAEAVTPLLAEPLRGSVYLRTSSNKLPDMVADLEGQIDVELVGRIDSVREGLRSRFLSVPDAPISSFSLDLLGGSKGLIQNSKSLCGKPKKANVTMVGQNGAMTQSQVKLKAACGKARSKRTNSGRSK